MVIKLCAFSKDSSAYFCQTEEVFTKVQLIEREAAFEQTIPFGRFYFDHEFVEGLYPDDEQVFDMWMRE